MLKRPQKVESIENGKLVVRSWNDLVLKSLNHNVEYTMYAGLDNDKRRRFTPHAIVEAFKNLCVAVDNKITEKECKNNLTIFKKH